ncbi:acetylglutamate kinase [Clostridium bovifaecis]|uniref:Acetylglutamate kinase n=1 Tax=Clostridium bovifaecis TaxID=2184719 RepID=A0A6I6EUU9_9CLOT|nr:acetylglutamate kinase [Clostridium bovifaecis]
MKFMEYLNIFKGKTFIIKYGGSIMNNKSAQKAFFEDVAKMKLAGINIVIVHGGGPEISNWLNKVGLESKFINGLRVTDKDTMEIVEMVLSGKLNKGITASLSKEGVKAIGISGSDSNLIVAKKKYANIDNNQVDIGFVGEVTSINKYLLLNLIEKNYVPVISPIGYDSQYSKYNINADSVSAFISSVLEAEKLIILTDVEGVYKDIQHKSSLINSITIDEIKTYIDSGIITGGMIPKMECCIDALEKGTKSVHLIDGRKEHCLINDILSNSGTIINWKGGIKKCQKAI